VRDLIKIIAPSSYSLGELANVVTMLSTLDSKWRVKLYVAPKNVRYVQASGFAVSELPRGRGADSAIRKEVNERDVAGVAMADHYLFGLEHFAFTLDDVCSGAPTVAFDSLCFGAGPTHLEMAIGKCEFTQSMRRWFPPSVDLPALPSDLPLLRAVPTAGLSQPQLCFNLFHGFTPIQQTNPILVKSRLGIEPETKLIVVALSSWASTAMLQPGIGVPNSQRERYLQLRFEWFMELMHEVGMPVALLGITENHVAFKHKDVQFINTGFLPLGQFTEILAAADLYLCDNITSGAMARAAFLGTPVMLLTNEKNSWDDSAFTQQWHDKMNESFPGFDFPYLVHPFGWIEELKPMLEKNPYLSSLPRAEAYDIQAQKNMVFDLLNGGKCSSGEVIVQQTADLPSGGEALISLLNL